MSAKQNTPQGLKEGPLEPEEQLRARTVISKEGDKYFWESNGNSEMLRTDKGGSDYFVDLQGQGFVEVVWDEQKKKYYYMENRSKEKSTYYGIAEVFLK